MIFFQGKEWKCYVCDNTLLKPLRAECRKVLDHIETENQKVKEKAKTPTNATPKSSNLKESTDSKKAASETKQDNKPKEGKQLLKVLTSSNPSSRSSSPSEFQKAIVTQPHAGTTINTEKIVIDPKTGNTTKFEMVYPNANIVRTQYKPPSRPTMGSTPTETGLSLAFTGLLPGNIHSIISNLLSMTDNLQELLKNIQENVIPESNLDKLPFEISLRTLSKEQLQARLTATNLVKSGVNLFLQEMAMKTSAAGVKAMNLSQQGSQPKMTSLLAGKPLDRNGGAMTIETPQKFDKPGGANSPLVTSTPKPKTAEDDSEIVLSSSPEKSVSQKSDICSESQDDRDDTMVNENEIAEKELLKDAAEELGSEDDDSDSENNVSTGKTELKGKGKLVVKLVDISNSTEKDQEKASSVKENVSSTTNEDSDNSRKRTRNKTKDETNEKDKECKPVRKTRSQSQDNDSDSDQSQSRSQGSDRAAQKGNKSNTASQNDKNTSKTNSKGKSESKGKPKESDDSEEDSSGKEGKSSQCINDKKIEKAAKKSEKNENKKTSVKTKSADGDSSHSTEDSDSDDTKGEIDDETDTTEDEDFEVSKSRRSSRRKSGTLPEFNILCVFHLLHYS